MRNVRDIKGKGTGIYDFFPFPFPTVSVITNGRQWKATANPRLVALGLVSGKGSAWIEFDDVRIFRARAWQ